MRDRNTSFVIGIDEVGRGALAGPVTVAAVAIPVRLLQKDLLFYKLKDSKRLTPQKRLIWYLEFSRRPKCFFALGSTSCSLIDCMNISRAANRAAGLAYSRLMERIGRTKVPAAIYLDGSLYLSSKHRIRRSVRSSGWTEYYYPRLNCVATTVTKGDELIPAVAAASIVAKVRRDRHMCALDIKHPGYTLSVHKGYATKYHREAIVALGPSPVHRLTFLSKTLYFNIQPLAIRV